MSEDSLADLQTSLDALKESVEKGDCDTIRKMIQELLVKAQPIQNRITTGDLQETDEQISKIKAEIRLATSEIETKCPVSNTKNNAKTNATNNVKSNTANNAKTNAANNAKTNAANNAKANVVNNTKANATNNVKTNAVNNTKANESSGANVQTGGKRRKTQRRKRYSRKA